MFLLTNGLAYCSKLSMKCLINWLQRKFLEFATNICLKLRFCFGLKHACFFSLQTNRQTDSGADRWTERQKQLVSLICQGDKQTDRHVILWTDRHVILWTDRQRESRMNIQTDMYTYEQIDRRVVV